MNIRQMNPINVIYVLVHAILIVSGFLLLFLAESPLSEVGAALLAAGIAGWVVFAYVLVSREVARGVALLTDFGIIDAFEARAAAIRSSYDTRLIKAKSNIDILGFGLRALREDYSNSFPLWKEQARVRILLINPESPIATRPYAEQRDFEENNPLGSIAADVHQFLRVAGPLIESGGRFQVKLYKCLPSVNIFRTDSELFWGPYLVREQSRNTPTLLIQRGVLFDRLMSHFDRIWNEEALSRAVPLEWLQ